uniref:Uncharacterized protein n=1 Tax=Canis lupus familiaris TaxID=9615 RepID=A0A8C0P7N7_CANLF
LWANKLRHSPRRPEAKKKKKPKTKKQNLSEHLLRDTGRSGPAPRPHCRRGGGGGGGGGGRGARPRLPREGQARPGQGGRGGGPGARGCAGTGNEGSEAAAITDVPVTLQLLQRRPLFAEPVLGGRGGGAGGPRRQELLEGAGGRAGSAAAAHPVHRGRGAAPQAALDLPQPPEGFQEPRRLGAPRAAGSRHRRGRRALARERRRRPGQAGRARGHIPARRTSGSAGRGLQPPLRLPGPQAAMTPEAPSAPGARPEVGEEPINLEGPRGRGRGPGGGVAADAEGAGPPPALGLAQRELPACARYLLHPAGARCCPGRPQNLRLVALLVEARPSAPRP